MKQTYKLISIFMILVLTVSTMVTAAPTATPTTAATIPNDDKGDKIIPSPTPPQGYTEEQIRKAIDISKEQDNNQTKELGITTKATYQNGDGMWIIWPYIDVQYYVYKYYTCPSSCYWAYPSLKIPLKTEIWDNNLKPAYNAYTYYSLYYWNYYTLTWSYLASGYKYTDSSGISRLGASPPNGIPYKTYSDIYYVYEYASYGGAWQSRTSFFNVGWY